MSISNRNGRALEFAYIIVFEEQVKPKCNILVEKNSSFNAAKSAWESISTDLQETFLLSANAGIMAIFDAEPLILEDGNDVLNIKIQTDEAGKKGDVRDILIIRRGIHWEIGVSVKNNHFAVKHSRLSRTLDFGEKWFEINCSHQYWEEIKPIFQYLAECKKKKNDLE